MSYLPDWFHFYSTTEVFESNLEKDIINPDSICFLSETGQIYTQRSFFGINKKIFKQLEEVVKEHDLHIKNILGIEGATVKDGKINNITDIISFLSGFAENDNLKMIIASIKNNLEGQISNIETNYLRGISSINTRIDSVNTELSKVNTSIREHTTILNSLGGSLDSHIKEFESLKESYERFKDYVEDRIDHAIQDAIDNISSTIESIRSSIVTIEASQNKLDRELNSTIIQLEELKRYTEDEITDINGAVGSPAGIAPLDDFGKVPSEFLPSYVDDVLEYESKEAFPAIGESGKIYVSLDDNLTYRWGGSAYVEISKSIGLGETANTAYPGNRGKKNADDIASHKTDYSNPHRVTKSQVGLGNVDNTSDLDKPISTATAEALDTKVNKVANKGLSSNDFTDEYKQIVVNSVVINPESGQISDATVIPVDEEDLTIREGLIQFKDRTDGNGLLNYIILRMENGFILTQDMINKPDTIYEIRYSFDLNEGTIKIPERCVLKFNGGDFDNGTLVLNDTIIESNTRDCLGQCNLQGTTPFIDMHWLFDGAESALKRACRVAKEVYYSPGLYDQYLQTSIAVTDKVSIIRGVPSESRIRLINGSNFISSSKNDLIIDGLTITGNDACRGTYSNGTFTGYKTAITLNSPATIRNIYISQFGYGINVGSGTFIEKCSMESCSMNGIYIKNGADSIVIDNVQVHNCGHDPNNSTSAATPSCGKGITILGALNVTISNSTFHYNTGYGIIAINPNYKIRNLSITNCKFHNNKYGNCRLSIGPDYANITVHNLECSDYIVVENAIKNRGLIIENTHAEYLDPSKGINILPFTEYVKALKPVDNFVQNYEKLNKCGLVSYIPHINESSYRFFSTDIIKDSLFFKATVSKGTYRVHIRMKVTSTEEAAFDITTPKGVITMTCNGMGDWRDYYSEDINADDLDIISIANTLPYKCEIEKLELVKQNWKLVR